MLVMVDHNTNADESETERTTTVEILYVRGAATRDDPTPERGSDLEELTRDLTLGAEAFDAVDVTPAEAIASAYLSIGRDEYPVQEGQDELDVVRSVYQVCQGPNAWGDLYDGSEARSMMTGDVVVVDGAYYMVDRFGFAELDVELESEDESDQDGDEDDEDDDEGQDTRRDEGGEESDQGAHASTLAAQLRQAEDEDLEAIGVDPDSVNLETDGGEPRYEAVDPVELERGDWVLVEDVGGDLSVWGEVLEVRNEAGRVGVILERSQDDREVAAWEETGRTFTRKTWDA